MPSQTYRNHRRIDPLYHLGLSLLSIALLIGSIVNLVQAYSEGGVLPASLLLVVAVLSLLYFFYIRRNSLVAQDRAIRAEENLRHYALTGKLLDARLTAGQIVALRFAGDAEFPALANRAALEGLKPDEIKKAVREWRADFHRV